MRFTIEEYTKERLNPVVRFVDIPDRKAKQILSGLKCIKSQKSGNNKKRCNNYDYKTRKRTELATH